MTRPRKKVPSALEGLINNLEKLKSKIPRAKHDEFLNHVGVSANIIARDYMQIPSEDKIGEAYLTFRSDEDPNVVLNGLNEVKNRINAPEELEIILYNKKNQVPQDENLPKFWDTIEEWGEDYLIHPYMLRARLRGATNLVVNRIVGDILGVLLTRNQSPFPIYDKNQYTDQQCMKHKKRYICSDEPALESEGIAQMESPSF